MRGYDHRSLAAGTRHVIGLSWDRILADTVDPKDRLVSAVDDRLALVKSDGSIWFSDPPFGIAGNYEGNAATPELQQNVYRVDGGNRSGKRCRQRLARPQWSVFFARRDKALCS